MKDKAVSLWMWFTDKKSGKVIAVISFDDWFQNICETSEQIAAMGDGLC